MDCPIPDNYIIYQWQDLIRCERSYLLTTPRRLFDSQPIAEGNSIQELATNAIKKIAGMNIDNIQSISSSLDNDTIIANPIPVQEIEEFKNAYRKLVQDSFLGKKSASCPSR